MGFRFYFWAGSLARIGRKPPKLQDTQIDWNAYYHYVKSKYSKVYAGLLYSYAKKYTYIIENPSLLGTFKDAKRCNVLKALVCLSKYLGFYREFKERLKDYGIKWSQPDCLDAFLRIFNNNSDSLKAWYNNAYSILKPNEKLLLRFALLTGLRKDEAFKSYNLIVRLSKQGNLSQYYNADLSVLEHFKFKELFLRRTKNTYISFIPEALIHEIADSKPVAYKNVYRKLNSRGISIKFNEMRDYFASFMVRHGLIREEVDLLQGRIPKSVFVRYYWSPSIKDLRDRTLKALDTLEQTFHISNKC